MSSVDRVLIVGGGIAGTALASQLQDVGISAEIVEIEPEWTFRGIGIAMMPWEMLKNADRYIGWLVGYALIVETIFRWPGVGYLLVDSVLRRDYPVAQGAFVDEFGAAFWAWAPRIASRAKIAATQVHTKPTL